MKKFIRSAVAVCFLTCALGLFAQTHSSAAAPSAPQQKNAEAQEDTQSMQGQLAEQSEKAAGEDDETAQFKHSPSVLFLAHLTGLSPQSAYWVFVVLNFAILAGLIVWFAKSSLPAMFRTRTATIQKGIEEARKASAEASARLSEIEGRLAKLDGEISALRTAAEADFSAEEQRIKQAAEEDAHRVVEMAEHEIAAAGKNARRELKAFVAELSVGLAEKKIKIDSATDAALVSGFVTRLGKDGK